MRLCLVYVPDSCSTSSSHSHPALTTLYPSKRATLGAQPTGMVLLWSLSFAREGGSGEYKIEYSAAEESKLDSEPFAASTVVSQRYEPLRCCLRAQTRVCAAPSLQSLTAIYAYGLHTTLGFDEKETGSKHTFATVRITPRRDL